ncbi:hypothetical protein A3J33_02985 [candidate division WWE3 bacterium RIFCSPLOWO2_02_FULL_53_10]|uniref:Response regulatory domain-containing protein n=2 Tax=Katanobacteria TaxID=422282 RepID=A0A1F4WGG3_UNCKA|nr:MAG: hypothetical protein A2890_01420 [candidate division WWE3 bacterium RIFCSPLOWO2_01_FULL_53_14]OGC68450.1 MAG: hypothetical protein A3J33_02985 [candidate division WWE3 bacterium RIFCSPLOWO2_02_FULL_53_10]
MVAKVEKKKKRILLLIEDNPLLSGLYQSAFEKAGLEVEIAHDGESGLALARQGKPSAILLDLLMPGMSGYEVLEALKKDATTKNIRVIILTIINEKEAQEKARKLGAVDYLIKTDLELPEIVKRVVSQLG